jgi:hypothetical protein
MATIAYSAEADRGEAKFFFTMACVMAATIVTGFAFNLAMGISSFNVPWWVHLHAFVMFGWVALYLLQNSLILADNVALHRRLGWLSAVWVPAILVLGMVMTRWSVQQHGVPPFLEVNEFLFSNPLMLLLFAGLVGWAVTVRSNTGWHRRLMYGAFTILTGPGVGRLLAPLWMAIEPWGWWTLIAGSSIGFVGTGMIADRRRYGAVHPAWFWVLGLIFGVQLIADLVAYSDWGISFTQSFVAGLPGGARPMEAFFPPM